MLRSKIWTKSKLIEVCVKYGVFMYYVDGDVERREVDRFYEDREEAEIELHKWMELQYRLDPNLVCRFVIEELTYTRRTRV